jgi:thioesterase domain-containing protein
VASLQARLSDRLGFRIPHTLFMEFPTIDAIARFLTEPEPEPEAVPEAVPGTAPGTGTVPPTAPAGRRAPVRPEAPRHLLPLNSPRPFFCAGGLGTTPLYLTALARALGDARPCYALAPPGLDGTAEPLDDLTELADLFADGIQQAQPRGPYLLGGHSFGGMVAYEAARRLRERGQQVRRVVLFDTYVPLPGRPAPADDDLRAVQELVALRHMACLVMDDCGCGVDQDRPLEEQGEQVARALGATDPASYASHLFSVVSSYQAGLRAFALYRPGPSDLRVTLVKPEAGFAPLTPRDHRVPMHFDSPNGWDTVALGDLTVVPVTGSHFSMFTAPHLAAVAEATRASLDGNR